MQLFVVRVSKNSLQACLPLRRVWRKLRRLAWLWPRARRLRLCEHRNRVWHLTGHGHGQDRGTIWRCRARQSHRRTRRKAGASAASTRSRRRSHLRCVSCSLFRTCSTQALQEGWLSWLRWLRGLLLRWHVRHGYSSSSLCTELQSYVAARAQPDRMLRRPEGNYRTLSHTTVQESKTVQSTFSKPATLQHCRRHDENMCSWVAARLESLNQDRSVRITSVQLLARSDLDAN